MEHALAEEGRAETDAVEATDQRAVLVGLDPMGAAEFEQRAIEPAMSALIQVLSRSAQAAITASNSRSATTLNTSPRVVLARLRETVRPSSGKTPSPPVQPKTESASRLSAIGNSPIE